MKGALVSYALPQLLPTIIVFQYNPEQVTRSVTARSATGGSRGDSQLTDGPPDETITLSVEIDAADQLEQPASNPITVQNGLYPALASLERLMAPPFAVVVANQVLSALGSATILGEPVPLTLFIWGAGRVVPVRVNSVSVTEQAFDTNLNPIQAKAELNLRVLTYRDLDMTNPGYWAYMASFARKEAMAALNTAQTASQIRGLLPF